jgi:hypothetical protein
MKQISPAILLILCLFLAACGAAGSPVIALVTPLPATIAIHTPTATPAPAVGESEAVATPTPLNITLPQGKAAAVAAATDMAVQPTPRTRLVFDSYPVSIAFDEFYEGYNMRTGLALSDKLVSLDGREILMEGYMAPPLKPSLDFFVLTRIRLEYCPFCSSAADWPDDIALVYMQAGEATVTTNPVRVAGRLEIGPSVDPETGMVSLVRIYAERVEVIQ